jgi:hypothetical protein
MADYTASRIDELPQLWDGMGKLVRKGLGLSAFGANILDLGPDYTTGPHDESGSGQEELYAALRGGGWVLIGPDDDREEAVELDPERMVRVGPGERRRLRSGPDGCRVLIVGAPLGRAYDPPDWSS